MPGASSGGSKHKDSSPGSRYSILNHANEFPVVNNQNKRRRDMEEYVTHSFFDKSKKLCDLQEGPKFLIMKRNEIKTEITLNQVSPFLLQKVIENVAGTTKSIKRMRDGTLLIETQNRKQADKICKMTKLADDINIKVYEHPTLNTTKGTIYCLDLVYLTNEEILDGLKDQHVIDVRRIMKKRKSNENTDIQKFAKQESENTNLNLVDTGVFVLTFNLPLIPKTINAGINRCDVKMYFPNPRRCFKCQRFGHGKAQCRSMETICGQCSSIEHEPEKCQLPVKCVNCSENHPSWSRNCPKFKIEMEIQKIQTMERVPNGLARKTFFHNNPQLTSSTQRRTTYSSTTKLNDNNQLATNQQNPFLSNEQVAKQKEPTKIPTSYTSTTQSNENSQATNQQNILVINKQQQASTNSKTVNTLKTLFNKFNPQSNNNTNENINYTHTSITPQFNTYTHTNNKKTDPNDMDITKEDELLGLYPVNYNINPVKITENINDISNDSNDFLDL